MKKILTTVQKSLRRWFLTLPLAIILIGLLCPIVYLLIRGFEADWVTLTGLIFRWNNAVLLWNTFVLTVGVIITTTILAFPLAWMTVRSNIYGRWFFTVMGVLPLSIPGYVMAYTLLAATGQNGTLAEYINLYIPRLDGFDGALMALSFTTFPYLFLNLRTALMDVDVRLEESARSLGSGSWDVIYRVIIPQLRPGYYAGILLVGLHVLGDFGVVSLMRFKTFSYALYLQYTASYDRIYAAWLALILIFLTLGALILEAYLLKGLLLHSKRNRDRSNRGSVAFGFGNLPGYVFVFFLALISFLLPVFTIFDWLDGILWNQFFTVDILETLWQSILVSAPAAFLTVLLALPVAYVGVRYSSFWSQAMERISYLGYATPRLAFALAFIVFILAVAPWAYQTIGLLILVYSLHFLAEAVGPIRSSLHRTSPKLEEAGRSLGLSPLRVFWRVLFPMLGPGMLVSSSIVFLSAMKELPITLLLAPVGFHTLAMNTWSYAEEAMFARAAPYALAIVLVSTCFVGLLLRRTRD